jgi:hypothetical protein
VIRFVCAFASREYHFASAIRPTHSLKEVPIDMNGKQPWDVLQDRMSIIRRVLRNTFEVEHARRDGKRLRIGLIASMVGTLVLFLALVAVLVLRGGGEGDAETAATQDLATASPQAASGSDADAASDASGETRADPGASGSTGAPPAAGVEQPGVTTPVRAEEQPTQPPSQPTQPGQPQPTSRAQPSSTPPPAPTSTPAPAATATPLLCPPVCVDVPLPTVTVDIGGLPELPVPTIPLPVPTLPVCPPVCLP